MNKRMSSHGDYDRIGDNINLLNEVLFNNDSFNDSETEKIKVLDKKMLGIAKTMKILEKYKLKDINILKVGHHDSKTSNSKEFINEINPRYSIISVEKTLWSSK